MYIEKKQLYITLLSFSYQLFQFLLCHPTLALSILMLVRICSRSSPWMTHDLNLQDAWIKWMKTKMVQSSLWCWFQARACIVDLRSKFLCLDLGLLVLKSRQVEIETCPYLISALRGLSWNPYFLKLYQHANLFREVQVDLQKKKCRETGCRRTNMPSYLYDQWWSWMISGVARLLSMGQKHVSLASWSSYSSFTQPQHACLASPPWSTFPEHSQDTCSKTVNLCQLLQKCFSQHWQFGASTHSYTANKIKQSKIERGQNRPIFHEAWAADWPCSFTDEDL